MKDIDELKVSKGWKDRFKLIEECQGKSATTAFQMQKTPEFKALSFWKKMQLTSKTFAFLFSFLWYFAKGMWAKGLVIFGFACLWYTVVSIIEVSVGSPFPSVVYWIPVGAVCSSLAAFDYYKFKVEDERMWKGAFFAKIFGNKSAIALFVIVAFALNVSSSIYLYDDIYQPDTATVVDDSTVIQSMTPDEIAALQKAAAPVKVTTSEGPADQTTEVTKELIDSAVMDYNSHDDSGDYKSYYALKDLNNDGKQEILVTDSSVCGSGGCTYSVYTFGNNGICDIGYVSDPVPTMTGDINCRTKLTN